jgi:hypothetical protein
MIISEIQFTGGAAVHKCSRRGVILSSGQRASAKLRLPISWLCGLVFAFAWMQSTAATLTSAHTVGLGLLGMD